MISDKERKRQARNIGMMGHTVISAGLLTILALFCSGCASDGLAGRTVDGIGSALHQPLDDFNIDAAEIPPTLVRVRSAPYALPDPANCPAIDAEIVELDRILGPDLDVPSDGKDTTSKSRIAMMDGMAHSAASSWIPFRGGVRWVTGAERHTRQINEAILAGAVRRGYLKGMSAQKGCANSPARAIGQPVAK